MVFLFYPTGHSYMVTPNCVAMEAGKYIHYSGNCPPSSGFCFRGKGKWISEDSW